MASVISCLQTGVGCFVSDTIGYGGGDASDFTKPFTLDARNNIAVLLAFVVSALALAAGVGGGAFYVPLFNVVVGFGLKAAGSTSQVAIFGGSLASTAFNLRQTLPGNPHTCIINFHLALILIPALLIGVDLGVLVNVTLPDWLIALGLVALLSFMCTRTATKGLQMRRREEAHKARQRQHPSQQSLSSQQATSSAADLQQAGCRGKGGAGGGIQYPVWVLAEVGLLWAVFLALAGLRHRFARCSWQFAAVMVSEVALCGASAVIFIHQVVSQQQQQKGEDAEEALLAGEQAVSDDGGQGEGGDDDDPSPPPLDYSSRVLAKSAAGTCVAGAVAGILGIGGGMLFTPLLLEFGVQPQVATATANLLILFTSSSATAAWATSGRLNLQYAAVFFTVSMAGALAGALVIGGYVRRSGRSSLLVLLLAAIMASGGVLTGVFGAADTWRAYRRDGHVESFHTWCQ